MAPKSIVFVTVDCLRADHVGFMGYTRSTTPFLDTLSSESLTFSAAIVAGTPTYYSLPAIMASRYPLALGRDVVGLAPEEPCLASTLKEAGYATAALAAANPYIAPRFGYDQGFDAFCDFLTVEQTPPSVAADENGSGKSWLSRVNQEFQQALPRLGPFRAIYDELYFQYCQRTTPIADSLNGLRRFPSAETLVDRACSWMDSRAASPIFLWLHLMDPHAPYYPKDEALSLMGDPPVTPFRARYLNSYWNRSDLSPRRLVRRRDEILKLYDAGIRWVDFQLERLVRSLKAAKRWEDCIFIVSADHGEEFSDHDGRFHPPSRVGEELIRVPLLLRVPGREKKLSNTPFSLLDLSPTLLDIAGVVPPAEFEGKSRWGELRDGKAYEAAVITECVAGCTNPFHAKNRLGPRVLSIREARFKLILRFGESEQLYDLEADPHEQAPLAVGAQRAVRKRMLEAALEHMRNLTRKSHDRQRIRALLRELQLESARSYPSKTA